ncbi:MAG: sugar kinase [Betaproteobacteria bacterium]|nr:MAG: sugar kinase [Betaproteobacteria bacterium]
MYEFSQIPGKAREYLQGFGGDTMNCAIAAARQGARVAYVTALGDDEFGRQMFELWQREGIDASAVKVDRDSHTAVYFISHTESGHRFSYLRKDSAASRFGVDDLPVSLLKSTKFFFTSGITEAISKSACEAVFAAIEMARSAGARIVFDANIRPALWGAEQARDVIAKTLPLTDYFLLSVEDAETLTGCVEPDLVLDWCKQAGAGVVVLKLGADGAIYSEAGVTQKVEGFRVHAVDATGAGDCFAGSLMARLSLGDILATAVNYACAAAALTCTGYGAVDPLPRSEHVFDLIGKRSDPATANSGG